MNTSKTTSTPQQATPDDTKSHNTPDDTKSIDNEDLSVTRSLDMSAMSASSHSASPDSLGALNLLLLGISIGRGHHQTNAALLEAFERQARQTGRLLHAHQADALDYFSQAETLLTAGMYDLWLRYVPWLYRFYYDLTDESTSPTPRIFSHLGQKAMRHDLQTIKPHVVVCSFPTLAALTMRARPRNQRFLNVLILTDYRVHEHWARPEADLICVPTKETFLQMQDKGIPTEKLAITGIPIDVRYRQLAQMNQADQTNPAETISAAQKQALRQKYALRSDLPVLLIAGGGTGQYRGHTRVMQVLGNLGRPVQVLVLAGAKQRGVSQYGTATIHELGFSHDVPELLALSDAVVGKAGGLTVAETTALGVPMVIYKPIPGQEEHNAAYLTAQGAAWQAHDTHQLRSMILQILEPEQRQALGQVARTLGRPYAADEVSSAIWQRLDALARST